MLLILNYEHFLLEKRMKKVYYYCNGKKRGDFNYDKYSVARA